MDEKPVNQQIWDQVEEFTRSMDQKAEQEVQEIKDRAYRFDMCYNLPA